MALAFAHGSIAWLSADAATTVYTVSGLSFQPRLIHFYWQGIGSATDTTTTTISQRQGHGFATSTSDRRCVATYDRDDGSAEGTAAAMVCTSCYSDDCIAATLTSAPARDGLLDLNSITSDGFTCIVDDAAPANITVFWEAWGGSDARAYGTGAFAEPAAGGTQNYTATGFTPGDNGDQVVMIAGVQSVSAANTAERNDSGLSFGWATGSTSAENVVIATNDDDGSAACDSDMYARAGECLAMITVAGGNPSARAPMSAFGNDQFTINW